MSNRKIKLITGSELARILKCSYDTIWRWKRLGRICPIGQLGHSDVYDFQIIKKLKEELKKKQNDRRFLRIGGIIDSGVYVEIPIFGFKSRSKGGKEK